MREIFDRIKSSLVLVPRKLLKQMLKWSLTVVKTEISSQFFIQCSSTQPILYAPFVCGENERLEFMPKHFLIILQVML